MVQPLIWIEGIIGVGKTTTVKQLGKALNLQVFYEPVNEKLLKIYYEDQLRWGFAFQIDMLHKRYNIQKAAIESVDEGKGAILDRGLPGDRVFAKMLMKDGKIHPIEWNIYEEAYHMIIQSLRPPNLLIYLNVTPEVAFERIKARNREAEQGDLLPLTYLKRLTREYQDLLNQFYSGKHPWSSTTEIWEFDYNSSWTSLDQLIQNIKLHFNL